MNRILLPKVNDLHVHLRQGKLMELVTPLLSGGGVGTVFVMPNLQPPIKNTQEALDYKQKLVKIDPSINYLMSLYLSPELTPEEIKKAAKAGIAGVKSYPRGVTTNSDSGIESYETYYPVFRAMEEVDMVLNLHGEIPSDPEKGTCILNAEERFLQHLEKLHAQFPKLRIVLEHATTKAAVEVVKKLGDTVGCTITAHHLELIVDDWAGAAHHYCKPVAKYPHDRLALQEVIREGHPRFFLGSDSAPHPRHRKEGSDPCAAGVFTSPYLLPYLATQFERLNMLDRLKDFTSKFGAAFYKIEVGNEEALTLVKEPSKVPQQFTYNDDEGIERGVVPFRAGAELNWKLL
ncbi:Dihydroorotase [Neoconidiobolus thromboides FSU 785]|nr:Dihydroorotase [Neoconidiobolus thromboides FSU 785]